MESQDLTFYHGTGASAARAIFSSGSRASFFEETGVRTLGREIRRALLDHARLSPDKDYLLHEAFAGYSSLWVPALRQLDEPDNQSLYEYGHFFVTLNIANAYRYAIGNPYRSEFVLAVAESLKVLERVGHPLPHTIATRFPEIVLRMGARTSRRSCNYFSRCRRFPALMLQQPSEFYKSLPPMSSPSMISPTGPSGAIHDSLWRPDPSRVAAVRHSTRDWLAGGATG